MYKDLSLPVADAGHAHAHALDPMTRAIALPARWHSPPLACCLASDTAPAV